MLIIHVDESADDKQPESLFAARQTLPALLQYIEDVLHLIPPHCNYFRQTYRNIFTATH